MHLLVRNQAALSGSRECSEFRSLAAVAVTARVRRLPLPLSGRPSLTRKARAERRRWKVLPVPRSSAGSESTVTVVPSVHWYCASDSGFFNKLGSLSS
jgi:hypothetical protein